MHVSTVAGIHPLVGLPASALLARFSTHGCSKQGRLSHKANHKTVVLPARLVLRARVCDGFTEDLPAGTNGVANLTLQSSGPCVQTVAWLRPRHSARALHEAAGTVDAALLAGTVDVAVLPELCDIQVGETNPGVATTNCSLKNHGEAVPSCLCDDLWFG